MTLPFGKPKRIGKEKAADEDSQTSVTEQATETQVTETTAVTSTEIEEEAPQEPPEIDDPIANEDQVVSNVICTPRRTR